MTTDPLYIAFFTPGTLYEREAARLQSTLVKHGLDHQIEPVENRGSWAANTAQTAEFLGRMMDRFPMRPLVYLDADAYVHSRPVLFDTVDCDIAVYFRHGSELLNGTLYLAPHQLTRRVIATYEREVKAHPGHTNEQMWLHEAIKQTPGLRLYRLPASYCFIFDGAAKELCGASPVIEHLQASREQRDTEHLTRRKGRLSELEGSDDLRRIPHPE